MKTTVYIWRNTSTDPGHASLELDGAYVSYWPQGEDNEIKDFVKNPPGKGAIKDFNVGSTHKPYFPSSYRHDCKLERRDCDMKIVLNSLDSKVIVDSWDDFKNNPKRYNMLDHNCSTVIATLLELGSGIPPYHTPSIKISEYVKDPYKKWYLKLRFMGNYIKMWTPNNVQKYALQLKSYKK